MIAIGSTILLKHKEAMNDDKTYLHYRCRLIDRQTSVLMIDYPINQQTLRSGLFVEGDEFIASFFSQDGLIYEFETKVIGRGKRTIPMLLLKEPEKDGYVRIQRRDFVRVETAINVALQPMNHDFPPLVSVSHDLSGGGCAVVIPNGKQLPNEGELNIWLVLPMKSGNLVYITAKCKIIRVFKTDNNEKERVSLQYIEMNERERQMIMKYCFEKQLILQRMKKQSEYSPVEN